MENSFRLKDRIVFITGASSGIGKSCALSFAARGAHLILAARRIERVETLATELARAHGIQTLPLELDVTNRKAVFDAVQDLSPEWRKVEVLVNNAGKALGLDKSYETKIEHLEGMMETNVKGLVHVISAIVPGMVERNQGHVIQIGSTAGRWVYPGGTVYCATKHAVRALNEGLKMDVHGTNVRVSSVDPGLVETEFSIVRFDGDAERADKVYADMTPLSPHDVADAVLWCATRPPHVNISEILLMCTDQSHATLINRQTDDS
ncbi:MAG: SDR family NAD(P)-dependent oxidoreductase [Bacteroidetes Order II. Incertae sedis bacterium]|jgi:3-hydroxy acid dehydrogenase / malonic semialdehyde reductase|nr:SDR family NAD(P)-dependent oxidoreductase [Bacteroidetes Order II. bacterium]MBT5249927.1 SDR family NAD(P)-dependent oxidoreductase [Bacteroidetes Order II. bacterium]MBT6200659.1 SDR family NAD(P)-dependent oxidoreductase [Bacteroidetes Order II. bacterium]MBT6425623.1 SDR family NAD(P)-dependent oxidoreductase [Bacteroidetes Order II. bacterium]MBT6581878.1 SDR family NAD(P)-dependent oxidoreductase [Bacteroidetes Order II. bacterium]